MESIQIKKYENRRLYSSSEKRYVTLAEISKWIIDGRQVQVIDVTNDKDITSEILTQILLEQGRAQHLPVDMLMTMIRLNESAVKNIWNPMLEHSVELMTKWNPFMNWLQKSVKEK
ncbi:MAG: polyhydroxyalkanoate synthesis regulator DNA-binding domain-containing protein [Pseudobdellovibrio sp.]